MTLYIVTGYNSAVQEYVDAVNYKADFIRLAANMRSKGFEPATVDEWEEHLPNRWGAPYRSTRKTYRWSQMWL